MKKITKKFKCFPKYLIEKNFKGIKLYNVENILNQNIFRILVFIINIKIYLSYCFLKAFLFLFYLK